MRQLWTPARLARVRCQRLRWRASRPFGLKPEGQPEADSDEQYFELWLMVAFVAGMLASESARPGGPLGKDA